MNKEDGKLLKENELRIVHQQAKARQQNTTSWLESWHSPQQAQKQLHGRVCCCAFFSQQLSLTHKSQHSARLYNINNIFNIDNVETSQIWELIWSKNAFHLILSYEKTIPCNWYDSSLEEIMQCLCSHPLLLYSCFTKLLLRVRTTLDRHLGLTKWPNTDETCRVWPDGAMNDQMLNYYPPGIL